MKRKLLAFVCLLAIFVGVFAMGATATTQENTYQVGYAKVDVSPWIKDHPSADANMTDDNGKEIGIPYDSAWEAEYSNLITKIGVVVDTKTKAAADVGFLAAPVGYSGRIYSTVIDTNGDNLRGKGDGIYATVTSVTDSDGNTVIFVTLDGIAGYPAMLNALKTSAVKGIAAAGGNLTADRIYVNGSHSHRGIDLSRLSSNTTAPGKAYWEYYKQMVTDAAVRAYQTRTPATMSKGQVDVSEACGHQMNFIRHYNTDKVDPETGKTIIRGSNFGGSTGKQISHVYDADDMLYLLQFTPTNGDDPIVLMNWRAHGTMVNTSDALSGDHIGAIRSTMENAGYRFAFLQGAAGNTVPSSVVTSLNTWKTETASGYRYSSVDTNATVATDENNVNHYAYLMSKAAKVCLDNHMEQLDAGEIRTKDTNFVSNKQKETAAEIEAVFYWHDVMGGPTAKGQTYTVDGVEHTFGGWPWSYTSKTGETAIFDSQYHISNAYDRNKTQAAQAATKNGSIRISAIMLGDEMAMVTCGNEMSDRFSATDELLYSASKGWYLKDNDNDWQDLYGAVYGMPFVLAYTNDGHAYMSNSLSYTYNEGSETVAGGCYESQTSSFAQGTGEEIIVEFKSMLESIETPRMLKCPGCNQEVKWTAINAYNYSKLRAGETGHYYLVEDISTTKTIDVQENATVCLDLNGHNLSSTQRVFSLPATATLNFVDSVGTSAVNATMYSSNPVSGIAIINGTCNIYGGSYRLLESDLEKGTSAAGLFSVQKKAHLNIYGGTLYGADLTDDKYGYTAKDGYGSAIYMYSNSNLLIGGDARIVSGTVPAHGAGTCIVAHDNSCKVTLQGNANVDEIYFIGIGNSSLTVSGAYTGTANLQLGPDVILTAGMDIGTSNSADLSGAAITCLNNPDYNLLVSGTNLILQHDPVAYIGQTPYYTLQGAVDAAKEGVTIRLAMDIAETVSVSRNLTLDLNGYDVTKVEVADGYTLACYDSQTNDHDVSDSVYGKVSGNVTAAEGYLAVTEADGTSFHKVDLAITAMSLRASAAGVYYKSNFQADDVAAKCIAKYGVALNVKGEPNETNMDTTSAYSYFTKFVSGDANGTLLKNIMKTSNTDANNNRNANMAVYGRPYILTTDGEYIFGETVQRSLKQQLEAIDAAWNNYSETAQETVITMYRNYRNAMKNWNIPNIKNEVDPAADDTMKIMMVGNSFCYYYVEELYGLLMANPDPNRGYSDVEIYNLYYSGCKLNQHYDWWVAGEAKYELYKTDKNGRARQIPTSGSVWKLEDALALDYWDYLSLQGASGETDYTDSAAVEANKASIAQYAGPLLDRFHALHPDAQLLWHRTWPFEVGRISGSITYTEALNAAYNEGMQITCDWMCNEFDQDKPYDLKIVNSGAAWPIAREANAKLAESLIPVGGLCARLGVANANTFQYVKDNPGVTNVGDGYHDGDIGGGQFLNACVWYETITGQSCLDNTYKPTKDNGNYELSDAFANLLRNAANAATIHQ